MVPILSDEERVRLLAPPPGPVTLVLDTDTYNEIDDQFALVYALLSPERLTVEAIYAAPFHNSRSSGPADGMEKSYAEIGRLLERLAIAPAGPVQRGATAWLPDPATPAMSAAAEDLIARARTPREGPLYVVAIGAITNVASALLAAPDIIGRIVVVWLGGQPAYWRHTREFNLSQDQHAARVVFDSGVALVHVPCLKVAQELRTTQAELERFVKGRGAIGDYLFQIFSDYTPDHFARSKEIWDLGAVAYLVNPHWADSALSHSPILTTEQTWSHDPQRHLIRAIGGFDRDAIFGDLFRKLTAAARM
jgi:purine nucleosidase